MKPEQITENLRARLGIEQLNPMQLAMQGTDAPSTLLLAPTGSGKTVAFTIPLLRRLGAPGGGVKGVVIAPSRELVTQIAGVIRSLASGYKTVAFYGGHPMHEEIKSLSVVPDIIVATPGRLLDHLNRHTVDLGKIDTLVLDEYDKSLELGFEDEMKRICRGVGKPPRLVLTSATRLPELPAWLPTRGEPCVVDFTEPAGPTRRRAVPRVMVESPARDKLDTLVDLLCALPPEARVIVFVNHREAAARVWERLRSYGLPAGIYHGALDQPQRENALEMLANGTTPVLVSTDLGSRGLDIAGVDAVIHYHMPSTPESWTHRNGRTARQDADGTVYIIASADGETIPPYVGWDRKWLPAAAPARCPERPCMATLYLNLGKKEKISRGDVAGFVIAKGGLAPGQVGRISVRDHCALVAVPHAEAPRLAKVLSAEKIKGKRVKVTLLNAQKL